MTRPPTSSTLFPYTTLFRSNKYAQGDGPDTFQIGARACNTSGAALSNVTGTFVWDSANPYINLAASTVNPITYSSLAAGTCTEDRKSTRLNSSHVSISYAVF